MCKYRHITCRYLLISCLLSFSKKERCKQLDQKVKRFFMFSVYVRIAIEAQQMMLISSFSEIKNVNSFSSARIASLAIAISHIVFSSIFWLFVCYIWVSTLFGEPKQRKVRQKNRDQDSPSTYTTPLRWNQTYMKEVFRGLKPTFKARSFYFIVTLRTLLIIFLAVVVSNLYVIIAFQFLYILLVIFIRPMEKMHLNHIKLQGEMWTFVLLLILIYFDNRKTWKSGFGMGEEQYFG